MATVRSEAMYILIADAVTKFLFGGQLQVAAVMTADFLTGGRPNRTRSVDWVGLCALAAGLAGLLRGGTAVSVVGEMPT